MNLFEILECVGVEGTGLLWGGDVVPLLELAVPLFPGDVLPELGPGERKHQFGSRTQGPARVSPSSAP